VSMVASVGLPAFTIIRMRRGRSRLAVNSATEAEGRKLPSDPWAAMSASVRAWVRLKRATL
jgi:hypothetical protein